MIPEIEKILPTSKVITDIKIFLNECNWEIEIADELIKIPINTDIRIQTRAFVLADAPDIFIGNHYEVVGILGCEVVGDNWNAKYGYLKMYYDLNGNFISEDRYPAGR